MIYKFTEYFVSQLVQRKCQSIVSGTDIFIELSSAN